MRLKILKVTGSKDLNVRVRSILKQACFEAKLNHSEAKYRGCGVWDLPKLTLEAFEDMTADLSLVTENFFIEDALIWLQRKEEDDLFLYLGDLG